MLRSLALASLLVATPALAGTYTISGTGSGSLDGSAWSGAFTITAEGGPPKPFAFGSIIDPLASATVTIGGKTVTITVPTSLANNTAAFPPPVDVIAFVVPSANEEVTFGILSGGFHFQDGFSATATPFGDALSDIATTGGLLSLSATGDVTFASASAPEASTWAMMLVGFVGVAFAGLRRRSAGRA
jgi:hypothetical protein